MAAAPLSTPRLATPPPSPSTFLSPNIAAELDYALDSIEELLLSGDADTTSSQSSPAMITQSSPYHANAPTTTTTTTTMMTTSTTTAKTNGSVSFSEIANNHPLANAVHMEVQENARLPTLNLQIDRSGTSWRTPAPRGRRSASMTPGGAKRSRPSSFSLVGGGGDDDADDRPASPKLPKLERDRRRAGSTTMTTTTTTTTTTAPAMGWDDDDGERRARGLSMEMAAFDDIMRLNEEDMNLFEWFMDGEDRSSAALAYSFSAEPPPPPMSAASLWDASDHGDGDIDGRGRRGARAGRDDGILPSGNNRQEINFPSTTRSHQPMSNTALLPYHRAKPLPIPVLKRPSPPRRKGVPGVISPGVVTGLNTNELVAATQPQNSGSPQSDSPLSSASLKPGAAPTARTLQPPLLLSPKSDELVSSTDKSEVKPPPHRWPPPPGHPFSASVQVTSRHYALLQEAANSKPKASITNATVQRSKFGFGWNHKVPSVPGPPPTSTKATVPSKTNSISTIPPKPSPSTNAACAAVAMSGKSQHPSSNFPSYKSLSPQRSNNLPCPSLPNNVGSVVAYERKKLRAKDARVQLNEAIDKLAVAIDLAGSQSKERFNCVVKITNCSNPHITPPAGVPSTPTLPPHPLARLMDDTIQQASTAKKWDRPSFIGLSATIINSLNAQCESLMREVARLRSTVSTDVVRAVSTPHASSDPSSLGKSSIIEKENGLNAHNSISGDQEAVPNHALRMEKSDSLNDAKSAAIYEERLANAVQSTVESPNLLQNIASYMDPASLCKCLCVSKRWRSQHIFENTDIWLNLCIKRYGVSAVRKWQDSDQDEDGVTEKPKGDNFANFNLYWRMAEKNVKPCCPMEGTLFLGMATSDGMVSCWVTLMDRSNGETSRSVMQEKIHGGETTESYAPLPVVELRLLVQNTGYSRGVIIVPDQQFTVDASTRRKGEKMPEILGDSRFKAQVLHIERAATLGEPISREKSLSHEMCHLRLFESAVLCVHIHARGCSTTAKFCNRSKKMQLLYSIDGTTRPLTIPIQGSD
ncbi:hypothetical protein ACHAXA_007671 [Cyclostephanos tholiformis]|uniref:F-box domain-containing protein n=1 Tax=Cyclostephanos tholiformis TaxID=382380 RepID=A0ABD3SDE5_9STRA